MKKSTTLSLRVNPDAFAIEVPKAPISINADMMTKNELQAKLKEGFNDIAQGNVQDASIAFQKFREKNV